MSAAADAEAALAQVEWGVVPLAIAVLCQDCHMIGPPLGHACRKCASQNVLALAEVLNRDSVDDDDTRANIARYIWRLRDQVAAEQEQVRTLEAASQPKETQ